MNERSRLIHTNMIRPNSDRLMRRMFIAVFYEVLILLPGQVITRKEEEIAQGKFAIDGPIEVKVVMNLPDTILLLKPSTPRSMTGFHGEVTIGLTCNYGEGKQKGRCISGSPIFQILKSEPTSEARNVQLILHRNKMDGFHCGQKIMPLGHPGADTYTITYSHDDLLDQSLNSRRRQPAQQCSDRIWNHALDTSQSNINVHTKRECQMTWRWVHEDAGSCFRECHGLNSDSRWWIMRVNAFPSQSFHILPDRAWRAGSIEVTRQSS